MSEWFAATVCGCEETLSLKQNTNIDRQIVPKKKNRCNCWKCHGTFVLFEPWMYQKGMIQCWRLAPISCESCWCMKQTWLQSEIITQIVQRSSASMAHVASVPFHLLFLGSLNYIHHGFSSHIRMLLLYPHLLSSHTSSNYL